MPLQAGKGHVPEENLPQYRSLASIARQYKTLGNNLSNLNQLCEANLAWQWSAIYWDKANALRVDLPTE